MPDLTPNPLAMQSGESVGPVKTVADGKVAWPGGEPFPLTEPPILAVRTLKEKLAEVAADCDYIRKDGVNAYQNYKYASAATVLAKVGESLYKNRLTSLSRFRIVSDVPRTRLNAKGVEVIENLVTVRCTLFIHDMDSDAHAELNGYGSGMDNGDKAIMKAQTAALKYAWMMGLNISTGDDPEADEKVDARAEGKPKERPVPRGPYKPPDTPTNVAPEPSEDIEPEPDGERPGIFNVVEPPSHLTKAELAAAAGHQVIANGGKSIDAIVEISNQITKSLEPDNGECKCGSPLVRKTTSKAKGSKPYVTCALGDKAFRNDPWALKRMDELELKKVCAKDGHTWRWA